MPTLRVLSEQHVRGLADRATAWTAIEAAYREFALNAHVQSIPSIMRIPGPRPHLGNPALGQYRVKGASVPSVGVAGAFLSAREYGYMFLWDNDTDEPVGLVANDWLSQYRVAVTMGVAIRQLGVPNIGKIALFGTGRYALEGGRLLASEWPDAELVVVATREESAVRFAQAMPRPVTPTTDARAAVEGADVVITITTAKAPIVEAGWAKPGALLLSMGSAHEFEIGALLECGGLIVDDLAYARAQGDIFHWLRRGDLAEDALAGLLRANIGEVVAGTKSGRMSEDERILAVIQGLTACDVAIAKAVLDRASGLGVGEMVRA